MTAAAEIRALDASHLDAIVTIERRVFAEPWARETFAAEIEDPEATCLGAFAGGELVGYLIAGQLGDAVYISNVAVDAAHQRRGIASALLEQLFALTADSCSGYAAEIATENEPSRCLFRRLGFEVHGWLDETLIAWREAGG